MSDQAYQPTRPPEENAVSLLRLVLPFMEAYARAYATNNDQSAQLDMLAARVRAHLSLRAEFFNAGMELRASQEIIWTRAVVALDDVRAASDEDLVKFFGTGSLGVVRKIQAQADRRKS